MSGRGRIPLLLLPGLLCDRAVWQPQIDALSDRVDCHVAHHGTQDSLAAMATQALTATPAARFAVAGHSMGGRVAFEMWRQAPERISHLALLDTSYHPLPAGDAGDTERAGRMTLLATARQHGMRAMARDWARGMVHESQLDGPVFDAILDMFERSTPQVFAAQIKALLERPDAMPLLPTITCPTLVLCGRDDAWSPPARHETMHQAIPRSRLVVVERCGHMSTMEQPDVVSQAFADWLGLAA